MSGPFMPRSAETGPRRVLERFGAKGGEGRVNFRVLLRLVGMLKPYRLRMAAAFCCMLVSSALSLASPYLIKTAVDGPIASGRGEALAAIALLLALSFVGAFLASAGQEYLLSWTGQCLLASLRGRLFRHIQTLSLGYHDSHSSGATLSRLVNDVAVIGDLVAQGLITSLGDTIVLVGIVAVMVSIDPPLALLTFSVLPVMLLVSMLFARRARAAFRWSRAKVAGVVSHLAENVSGMKVIQAFSRESQAQELFDRVNRENRDAAVSAVSLSFLFIPSVEFIGLLATGIVLWFGGKAVSGGAISLGVLVAFLSYIARFFQPLQDLSQLVASLQAAAAGGERVLELLDARAEVCDRPAAPQMPPIRGRIEFRRVGFSYTGGRAVLRDVDFTVEAGQVAALVGPTGAGKTTIVNLIARFYDVCSGQVLIDGLDVREVAQASLRRQLGLVGQDPFIFKGTIADNIRFGKPGLGGGVREAARLAGLEELLSRLPEGTETALLEGGANLSSGQKQLVALARAFYADPRILLLDEATSSVDLRTESLIREALKRLLRGRTALVIAHRLSTVYQADVIFMIREGRLEGRGKHEELMRLDPLYRELCLKQMGGGEARP